MDDTTCMVRACRRIARFYYAESRAASARPAAKAPAGCTACSRAWSQGKATLEDLNTLKASAGQIEGHTICAFGEAAAWPVQGFLRHYWHEFEYFILNGRSIVDVERKVAA